MSSARADFLDPAIDCRRVGLASRLQRKGQIFAHGQMPVEGAVLKDHGNIALLRRHVVDELSVQPYVARRRLLQAGDQSQDRRLAASLRPQEHEQLGQETPPG